MAKLKVGIAGNGAIGLAYAASIGNSGLAVSIWSPRGSYVDSPTLLHASGVLDVKVHVALAKSVEELAAFADVIVIAVPVNVHKRTVDELLPHLRSGQTVIVSSMGSLSSLYLFEAGLTRGLNLSVASFGTTVFTARRTRLNSVNVMSRRPMVSVSCLPLVKLPEALETCRSLFGDVFDPERDCLATTLANSNPISHVPLALFNWTRIERAEDWPQYRYMTPLVSGVIEKLDSERIAIARAFGIDVTNVAQHLARSFNVAEPQLADIAAELHKRRGGPPGPTDVGTRYLDEDVPFGLVFLQALADIAHVDVPVTSALISAASVLVAKDYSAGNELIPALGLPLESVDGLLARSQYRGAV